MSHLCHSPQHSKIRRFIPLRYRFFLLITGMLVLILSTLSIILGSHYSRTIINQIEGRGLAIAQSLAAASTANLLTYNYVALERSANQAALASDIVYVIYHDKEGRVAGHSGRADLQNKLLQDAVTQRALLAEASIIQNYYNTATASNHLDIAVAVFPPGIDKRWGIVRVGLTLAPVRKQIQQMVLVIAFIGLIALICGALISFWVAQRITRPLDHLVMGTQEAAQGNLNQKIAIQTGDEIEVLAANFATMIGEIQRHRHQLEQRLSDIQHMQRYNSQLLTTMSDGLICIDMQGRITTVNPAALQLLQGPGRTISKGEDIDVLLPDLVDLHGYIQKMIDVPKEHGQKEVRFVVAGENKAMVAGAGILRDPHGKPLEIILNLHDITAFEKLETSMRQNQIVHQHKVLQLERENLQARFEVLKSQLSPHFLFNTFGTLITLIEEDRAAAVQYVEELSRVYRYLLQTRDKKLVSLENELDFVDSYTFLVQHRFGHNIEISVTVPYDYLSSMVPPLSVQLLIENAVKHNIISSKKPLLIEVKTSSDDGLVVKNNLQKKRILETPTKVGLANLSHRYEFFTDRKIVIQSDAAHFVVKLPLLRRTRIEVN